MGMEKRAIRRLPAGWLVVTVIGEGALGGAAWMPEAGSHREIVQLLKKRCRIR